MDHDKPTVPAASLPESQEKRENQYQNTVDRRQSQGQVNSHDVDSASATPGLSKRIEVAASTEIGDPNRRIPSDRDVRGQLETARTSELPVGASRSVQPCHLGDTRVPATHQDDVGKANYAPGYEQAYHAVPQKTYEGAGHAPVELPHEKLEPGTET